MRGQQYHLNQLTGDKYRFRALPYNHVSPPVRFLEVLGLEPLLLCLGFVLPSLVHTVWATQMIYLFPLLCFCLFPVSVLLDSLSGHTVGQLIP